MNKIIDNETLLLKVESHDHRIEMLENILNAAKEVLTLEEAAVFMGVSKSSLRNQGNGRTAHERLVKIAP